MPNIFPMIKVIQSNVSDIHTHHLGTSSLFFNKFSMLQLYKYIQKANNKLKGPHHTVLQANKKYIERTLEQIFHCFLICPNNQQLICNTVADKKNVAFSHQNNHFGLNKSIERMSRIYNRIFNG